MYHLFLKVLFSWCFLEFGVSTAPTGAPTSVRSSQNSIFTIAGTGSTGSAGVGGFATAATFSSPRGVWENTLGILYVSGQGDNCVRKFNTKGDSTMTKVAGQCGAGDAYAGDNGPATSAYLGASIGLTGDSIGNIYIGLYASHRAQRVNSAGIISTYAGNGGGLSGDGGQATSAGCPNTVGVWMNTVGVLYLVVYTSHAIRAVDTSGIITRFAGTLRVLFFVVLCL